MSESGSPIVLKAFLAVLALVALSGFIVARGRRSAEGSLEEWGLGGRHFGTLVTWFLIGGDFYTAYTIMAVPALVFATGAAGFFALPYTILVYPFVFVVMPRLWAVSKRHQLLTVPDYIQMRYGSRTLATLVAGTGIIALMPYIALQLVGIETALAHLGFPVGHGLRNEVPMLLSFSTVTAFAFFAGLRGPAAIAFSKDIMIYMVVIAAVTLLPLHFGGYRSIFAGAEQHFAMQGSGSLVLLPADFSSYATLALGSALAAFLYPHTATSILAASSTQSIRRNAVLLPAYTVLLGLLAILGIAGASANLQLHSSKEVIPSLFAMVFPPWFLGFAYAAIVVAAAVPAAIMAISAANLFTRNIHMAYINQNASPQEQLTVAKYTSLVVNVGALAFVYGIPAQYMVNLQLMGGVLILQTFPAVVCGLWQQVFHHKALIIGWIVSLILSMVMFVHSGFKSAVYPIRFGVISFDLYIGIVALVANVSVSVLGTLVMDIAGVQRGEDRTVPGDYEA